MDFVKEVHDHTSGLMLAFFNQHLAAPQPVTP
jgi:hypothetical protein